jgi:oligosaccharide repeat unit polymerase
MQSDTLPIFFLWMLFASALIVQRSRGIMLLNPVSIAVGWWCLWLSIALFAPSALDRPSVYAIWCFVFFLGSVLAGGMLASPNARQKSSQRDESFESSCSALFWPFLVAQTPFTLYYLYKSRSVFGSYLGTDVRAVALGIDSGSVGSHAVFGSSFMRNLYDLSTAGLNLIMLSYAIYQLLVNRRALYLVAAGALVFANQMISFGRINVYLTVLVFAIIAVMAYSHQRLSKNLSTVKLLSVVGALIICASTYATYSFIKREGSDKTSNDFVNQFVDYHTMGFTMFSIEVDNPSSYANTRLGLGNATSSGMQQIMAYFLRRFFPGYMPASLGYSMVNQEFVRVGSRDGKPLYYNAYYTIIHPIYCDFRLPGVILLGLMYGYILSYAFLRFLATRGNFFAVLWIGLLFQAFYSLHYPPTEKPATFTWLALLFVLGLSSVSRILQLAIPSTLRVKRNVEDGFGRMPRIARK